MTSFNTPEEDLVSMFPGLATLPSRKKRYCWLYYYCDWVFLLNIYHIHAGGEDLWQSVELELEWYSLVAIWQHWLNFHLILNFKNYRFLIIIILSAYCWIPIFLLSIVSREVWLLLYLVKHQQLCYIPFYASNHLWHSMHGKTLVPSFETQSDFLMPSPM